MEIAGDDYNETRHVVRITCLVIALLSNFSILAFMIYKIGVQGVKRLNVILSHAMFYISCTIISSSINLLYRWLTPIDGCEIAVIVDEIFLYFTRSNMLLFYVIMITKIFDGSKQTLSRGFVICLTAFIIAVHGVVLPVLLVLFEDYYALQTPSFGVFCLNEWTSDGAICVVELYHVVDSAVTLVLCTLFISKLMTLVKTLKAEGDDDQTKLLKLVKKSLSLTLISVISSWIITFGGSISGKSVFRWIYPLDYVFNAWCVLLIFEWTEFQCLDRCFEHKEVHFDDAKGTIQISDMADSSKRKAAGSGNGRAVHTEQ